MALAEQIKELKSQGYEEKAIINYLKEQGISPKEINDALSQSKIKAAITEDQPVSTGVGRGAGIEGMQKSVIDQPQGQQPAVAQDQQPDLPAYAESVDSNYGQQSELPVPQPQQGQQGVYDYSQPYSYQDPGQGYGGYVEYQPDYAGGGGADIMTEVAEQVVAEKIADTLKQIEDFSEFKARAESQVSAIDNRLQKIEALIDSLQVSIVRKIGSYSQDVQDIKAELGGMQDSFSKMVNPFIEHVRAREKPTRTRTTTRKTTKKGKGGRPRKKPKSMVR